MKIYINNFEYYRTIYTTFYIMYSALNYRPPGTPPHPRQFYGLLELRLNVVTNQWQKHYPDKRRNNTLTLWTKVRWDTTLVALI